MTLKPGTHFGPYELLALLGVGGMGEVYRAIDTRLGRPVAVKIIAPGMVKDRGRVKRFELEARATGALNHPNVISIYDIGTHKGTRFVVMELAEGRALRDLLKDGPIPVRQAVDYAAQAAAGLEAAHAKGIVHRDLTPGNLIVSAEGRVKVLDFGLAKLVERQGHGSANRTRPLEGTSITEEGTVAGTVPYMSPEQLRGEGVDQRTDLFTLGIVLYEMVTGRRPFEGETAADVASAILRDPFVPAQAVRHDVPGELDTVIGRCLEKDPARRIPTAREVGEELRRVIHRLDDASRASPTPRSRESPPSAALDRLRPPAAVSIAVLPFANRSPDEEDEYFSDGLTDEMLSVLGKIQGVRVVGRTSSYQFKGKNEDLRVIGHKLNVATILEGSVRRTGNRVRIGVQLVKVSDGFQLWSQTYDRTLDDIFAVQDNIAQSVVQELRTTLLGTEPDSKDAVAARADVAAAARGRGGSGEAYRLYLQGCYFVNRTTREDIRKGVGYLIEALQAEPTLALGWADLSGAYAMEAGYGWSPLDAGIDRARKAAERALELEPDLAEGHARLGAIQMNFDRNWKAADASFRRALEAAPGNGFVLRLAGNLASNLGRLEEAITLYRRAVEQDPLSSASHDSLAITYRAAGRYKEAEESYRMALELAPHRIGTRYGLALVLLAQGRGEEALAESEREPEEVFRLWSSAVILHELGRVDESDARLKELIEKHAGDGAYQIAEVYGARGDADAAFEWLERAHAQGDGGCAEIRPEPVFRAFHGDPRWRPLLKRMGVEDGAGD